MPAMRAVFWFTLLAVFCSGADALFTKVKQNHPKCFIEELHKDEVVIVHYKSPDQSPLPAEAEQQKYHVGVNLEVTQGATKVFEGRTDVEGRFAFTALQGEHHLCLSVEGQSLGQDFRIHLEIKVGLNDVDYEKVAKKEHLSSLELQVRKLKDDVNRVRKPQPCSTPSPSPLSIFFSAHDTWYRPCARQGAVPQRLPSTNTANQNSSPMLQLLHITHVSVN
mmetsp:Transcript_32857/g.82888  ORF Transcript_32857/g.82888 Transcript_32857/m.82888 type:complete len:221 (+) Transcript_32857:177-839(+)